MKKILVPILIMLVTVTKLLGQTFVESSYSKSLAALWYTSNNHIGDEMEDLEVYYDDYSVSDQKRNYDQYNVANNVLNLFSSTDRFQTTHTGESRYLLRRIEISVWITVKTSYEPAWKSDVYSFDVTMKMKYLDSSRQVVDSSIVTKHSIGHTDKANALDDVLVQFKKPIREFTFKTFPIYALITDIVDRNKSGEVKKVTISVGSNTGVQTGFKFNLIDNSIYNSDEDLIVTSLGVTNSICKVVNHGIEISKLIDSGKAVSIKLAF